MQDTKRVFLVDALALIYRAHYAFINNPRINSKGQNTSAIFGFINSILDLIEKEKPTHIAVAFDSYEPTVRHEDFSEYKANRDKQPEDISYAIPVIKQLLFAMKIPVLEIPGYEADDIIATLSKKIPKDLTQVFMFTPDKDYAQLVNEDVFILKPSKAGNPPELWDTEKVINEFGIKSPEQVIDIQSLTGDAVDNIPGVPGIGPKTAQSLISEYTNLENLLKNTDKLKGKVKENLELYAEQARMSYQLAKLITDVPVEFDDEFYKTKEWDRNQLEVLFSELEFRNLGKRILGKEIEIKKGIPVEVQGDLFQNNELQINIKVSETTDYKQITSKKEFDELMFKISKSQRMSLKTITTSSNIFSAENEGVAISTLPTEAYFINFKNSLEWADEYKKLIGNPDIKKIGYDLKTEILRAKSHNYLFDGVLFDNQIAHYLIDSDSTHEFSRLCQNYLFENLNPVSENWASLCREADYNLRLYDIFRNDIDKLYPELYYSLESPLIQVLAQMEYNGVKIDSSVLSEFSKEIQQELKVLESKIFNISGISFNVNSPQQLGHVLFNLMKLDPDAKKTKKSGQYSTGEEVLVKLAEKHEIARLIMDYRELQKLKSTYLDALPQIVNPESGLIHTSYEQAVASTGRLSSRNPNLQNIPIRTERGRQTRKAFIPRKTDNLIISADYSQIELRVVAHFSGDEAMKEAFINRQDIHTSTAAKVFGVNHHEVTPEMRRKAKEVNFGIIYGISSWGLSQRLGISKKESAEIIEQYFKSFPGIKKFMDESIEKAREKGFAETFTGRRRYLRDINSRNAMQRSFAERNAINAPVQGSAADIIKLAMLKLHHAFEVNKLQSKMIMQVHDELVFDVVPEEAEQVKNLVKVNMENASAFEVPLLVDIGSGKNWLEAH